MKKTHPTVIAPVAILDELIDILDKKSTIEEREKAIKAELRAIGFKEWLKHKETSTVVANSSTRDITISFTEAWRGWDIPVAQTVLPASLVPHVKSVQEVKIDLSELIPSTQAIAVQAIKAALEEIGVDIEQVFKSSKKAYPQKTFTDARKDLTLAENISIDEAFPMPQTIKVMK